MDCECGGHKLGPSPAIWSVSVVVSSLSPGPVIWTISVVVMSLPYE